MADKALQIDILDNIGGWGYSFRDLYAAAKGFKGDKIRVVVNSFGGSVLEGLLIHNYLKGHKAQVETHIPGYAMSMGTIIAAAGDHVTMADTGYYMIHNPWAMEVGDHRDMESMGQLLLQMKQDLAAIYVKRTGLAVDKIVEMMDAETWLTAQQALDLGFVDELTTGARFEASVPEDILSQFQNVPAQLAKPDTRMNDEKSTLWAKLGELLGIGHAAAPEKPADLSGQVADLQAQVAALTADLAEAQNSLADADASVAALTAERDALQARVVELEHEPADTHTEGRNDGDPAEQATAKSYHLNPLYLEARRRAGLQ